MSEKINRKLFLAFTELQILYHASKEPINGTWIIDEINNHGYSISPGTLYPILNNMDKRGLLDKDEQVVEGKVRKYYTTTKKGLEAFDNAKNMANALMDEISA